MTEKYIPIICRKETAKVKVSDVIMIERYNRKLRVVTDDRSYEYYEQLEEVEGILDSRFYCCRKGCYINLEKVLSMSDQSINFENGTVFYLGRDNFIKARQRYKLYLKNCDTK